ncbi:MAG TPA: winged helix-turn-helix transcriptional regulator [Anaerolineales bacterium]|nr:winged helix-turn-helix transcriptional regulator [Anaerolineales bacterium]
MSRADLAEKMGLTRAAVTVIINDLISSGIILENTENRSTANGRPPVGLEINPDQGLVAAVDMGAMHLSVALGIFPPAFWKKPKFPFG